MSDDEYVPLELYESQESDSEEVEERNILKKRRGINREWIYMDLFDDKDAADLWLKNETKWSKEDTYSTNAFIIYSHRYNYFLGPINYLFSAHIV